MVYLDNFRLPTEDDEYDILQIQGKKNGGPFAYINNSYPCGLFTQKELSSLDFKEVTILYGGNGSGKSTLLNIIAKKLGIKSFTPINTGEMFDLFLSKCSYGFGYDDYGYENYLPDTSRIIKSDDIFDYMLAVRGHNQEIANNSDVLRDEWAKLKYGETVKLSGLDNYEEFRLQVESRRSTLSRRNFLKKIAGREVRLNSNGETALEYFDKNLKEDGLYLLDEPENSLSPKKCLELKKLLEEKARYYNCQFIIATHSPFILSIEGAKIYDLDTVPVDLKDWWELENTKVYFDYFYKNKDLFLKKK